MGSGTRPLGILPMVNRLQFVFEFVIASSMPLVSLEDFGPKTSSTLYALDSFRNYWNENERLIEKAAKLEAERNTPAWNPQTDDEHGEFRWEQQMARQFHDAVMTPTFRYSSIVMLYVIIERELLRVVANLDPSRSLKFERKGSSVLDPVAQFCEANFQLRLQNAPDYQAVCDLQKVRNCIVHCRGDVSLSRDMKYLIQLKGRRIGFYAWEELQIDIESECIDQFLRETWHFFVWIFNNLKWKIDDSWNGKKWISCESVPKR